MKFQRKLPAPSNSGFASVTKRLINGQKLFFDARYIRVDHHDGISRYSAGIASALFETHQIVAIVNDLRQLEHLPTGIEYVKLNDPTDGIAELRIARKLNRLGAKLVYSPMQTMGSWGRRFKLMLTLHDLIYYSHKTPPPSFSWPIKLGWRLFHLTYLPQRFVLNRADAVATVSRTTKRLMQAKRLTSRPIEVVYNAGSLDSVKRAKSLGPSKSLVYMGSFMGYKNVETLVSAMAQLPGYELRLLSKITDARREELRILAGSAANRVVFLGGVSDAQYQSELDNAFALVSASLDEGFGIPVVEAMERATPVVISDIEIFKEIGGDAAKYFDAKDIKQLVRAIESLESKAEYSRASAASLKRANDFSWKQSAAALVAALEKL